jgi:hypothetical protein
LIDVVAKGYLKLGDAQRLNFIFKQQERHKHPELHHHLPAG